MIKKLKTKFTVLAVGSLFVLLTVVVAGMNIINYNSVIEEADATLSVLSKFNNDFPKAYTDFEKKLPPDMSPEVPYESRFFTVTVDSKGKIVDTEMSRIASISQNTAEEYAEKVITKERNKGFIYKFRYSVVEEYGASRIIFLDCGRKLDSFNTFLTSSITISIAALIASFIIIFVLSGKIIKPISENYEKQKRFITDAGHEIKTPLTVISANVDILEMEFGKNESLCDISDQTKRLRNLTDELILLSRTEEYENSMIKIDFPISDVVSEAIHPFLAPAALQNKKIKCDIAPMLTFFGNDKSINRLVCILLDNAVKYSPEGSTISTSLTHHGRNLLLTVTNPTETEIKPEQLNHVFDRFYRTDSSRNSETGGHGIGLSVAKSIVISHGGKIQAFSDTPYTFRITVQL